MQTGFQDGLVEVDEQAKRHVEQFHVTQKLGLVDRKYRFDGFVFYQQAIFDEEVDAQSLFENQAFVLDGDRSLADRLNACKVSSWRKQRS